jgi:hypothetical protein
MQQVEEELVHYKQFQLSAGPESALAEGALAEERWGGRGAVVGAGAMRECSKSSGGDEVHAINEPHAENTNDGAVDGAVASGSKAAAPITKSGSGLFETQGRLQRELQEIAEKAASDTLKVQQEARRAKLSKQVNGNRIASIGESVGKRRASIMGAFNMPGKTKTMTPAMAKGAGAVKMLREGRN